ncbi:hypothetical protein SNOG_05083 [Parastagonospora nodorum SN15]|uniref:Uncharacterized protein n=1 Tax=Phaeosphaeria nodorum (strain SN15 / ATCC MYA-4574 / FGSC 10173) TaxID=321614 RepID=Q0UT31_PHANO|nr:hypothetical protein SNOG_05083 [Parastagonospora nodorum SN15]EAT87474.1 hypothetical protein SNOG_05083 [Parastagonospora nodorum SN15]
MTTPFVFMMVELGGSAQLPSGLAIATNSAATRWVQPPPRLAAQEKYPVEQVYADVEEGVGVGVGVVDVVVGTMITAVEDGGGGGGEEEGST